MRPLYSTSAKPNGGGEERFETEGGNETGREDGSDDQGKKWDEKSLPFLGDGWVTPAIGLGGAALGILIAGFSVYGIFRCYRKIKDSLRHPVHRIHDDILLLKNQVSFLNAEMTSLEGRRGSELWDLRNTIERSSMRVQVGLERLERSTRSQEKVEVEKMLHSTSSILKTERKELQKFATVGGRGSRKNSGGGGWTGSLDRKDGVSLSSFKPVQRGKKSGQLNEWGVGRSEGAVYLSARVPDYTHYPGELNVERSFRKLSEEDPDAIHVEAGGEA